MKVLYKHTPWHTYPREGCLRYETNIPQDGGGGGGGRGGGGAHILHGGTPTSGRGPHSYVSLPGDRCMV